jgi:hypothetical protein
MFQASRHKNNYRREKQMDNLDTECFKNWLNTIVGNEPIGFSNDLFSKGVYVIWYKSSDHKSECLKVGIATGRGGLLKRISDHFVSRLDNSILARRLCKDETLLKTKLNLNDQSGRQQFLREFCYFKIMPLPNTPDKTIRLFEKYLEKKLNPRYLGRQQPKVYKSSEQPST